MAMISIEPELLKPMLEWANKRLKETSIEAAEVYVAYHTREVTDITIWAKKKCDLINWEALVKEIEEEMEIVESEEGFSG